MSFHTTDTEKYDLGKKIRFKLFCCWLVIIVSFSSLLISGYNEHQKILRHELLGLSKGKPLYAQIRYLDLQGKEAVRIDPDRLGNNYIILDNKLQNTKSRYYFTNVRDNNSTVQKQIDRLFE